MMLFTGREQDAKECTLQRVTKSINVIRHIIIIKLSSFITVARCQLHHHHHHHHQLQRLDTEALAVPD